jgi:hypothetical protein
MKNFINGAWSLPAAIALALLLGMALAACHGGSERTAQTPAGYQVEALFTHEGCTVYRFYDAGTRYFTDCRGSTQWDERSGKTSRRVEVLGAPQ